MEGNGIGLYLAKKMVDAANGKIVVESELGIGSKFILYFKTVRTVSDLEYAHKKAAI